MESSLVKALAFSSAVFFLLSASASAQAQQGCGVQTFSNGLAYELCTGLPVLGCSIHWNRNPNATVSVAYTCSGISASARGWMAWGPNLSGGRMVGTQALVGYVDANGQAKAHTTDITEYRTSLAETNLTFPVTGIKAELSSSGLVVFATLQLPSNFSGMTQVWQMGPMNGDTLGAHSFSGDNVRSVASWDITTGTTSTTVGVPRLHRKNVHGVLNAVSWGILLPIGAMTARYLKVSRAADPAWFYLHVTCQTAAYAIGVAGWGTGLKLGSDSAGIKYSAHRNIGTVLFCLGTLQVFALLLRPKKDHKLRLYWNIYHHSTGYAVIILSIINIYKGFDILDPEKKWKRAYTGIIIALGGLAALLEAFTWVVVLRRNKNDSEKTHHSNNGVNAL